MTLTFENEAIYPDGWEVLGTITVEASVWDASFSYSHGSINAVQPDTDADCSVESFEPDDIARDVREGFRFWTGDRAPLSRKRTRKARRQIARRLARLVNSPVVLNEWMNENERKVWREYRRECEESRIAYEMD